MGKALLNKNPVPIKPYVERHGYAILAYRLDGNKCTKCGATVAGRWAPPPGDVRWGFLEKRN